MVDNLAGKLRDKDINNDKCFRSPEHKGINFAGGEEKKALQQVVTFRLNLAGQMGFC